MAAVVDNLTRVHERIAAACAAVGRSPTEVKLIAVSKRIPLSHVLDACRAGHCVFGENRIQDALPRQAELARELRADGLDPVSLRWHFIGNLQTNKVRKAVGAFALIHGVDSTALARKMGAVAVEGGFRQPVLLQVNTSNEARKHGFEPDVAVAAAQEVAEIAGLRLDGFMTMGRATAAEAELRHCFDSLRRLSRRARETTGLALPELSMGMSHDFEAAIAAGATMVRIGTAIFGPRNPT